MPQTDVVPVGTTSAQSRKESPYDSEGICNTNSASLPSAGISLFIRFDTFLTNSGTGFVQKQNGRDTNLGGPGGALPTGYELAWYEWRNSVRTLDANLSTGLTVGVFEQMNRIRELGFVRFFTDQAPLLTAALKDTMSFVDSTFVSQPFGVTTITPCVTSRGGKPIIVGGEPYMIRPTERFSVFASWPGSLNTTFTALIAYYLWSGLDGILSRPS